MNNPTEDEATDIRTRDLAARQKVIMDGALGSPWEPPRKQHYGGLIEEADDRITWWVNGRDQAHPRRTDWYRVAALTIVILAVCAAGVALAFALAYALGAF